MSAAAAALKSPAAAVNFHSHSVECLLRPPNEKKIKANTVNQLKANRIESNQIEPNQIEANQVKSEI